MLAFPRKWLHGKAADHRRSSAEPPVPFRVVCSCGRELAGQRTSSPQIVLCPGCQARHFVFPISPWRQPTPANDDAKAMGEASPERSSWWLRPLLAASLTLVLIASFFMLAWEFLGKADLRRGKTSAHAAALAAVIDELENGAAPSDLQARIARQRAALERESRIAFSERVRLMQMHSQLAAILDLAPITLEQLLDEARQTAPATWRERFQTRYAGKTVLLLTRIPARRDDGFEIPYVVRANGTIGRLHLDAGNPSALPPGGEEGRKRLLFAARLASCKLEAVAEAPEGEWVIRLDGDGLTLIEHERLRRIILGHEDADDVFTVEASGEPTEEALARLVPGAEQAEVVRILGAPEESALVVAGNERREQWKRGSLRLYFLATGKRPLHLVQWTKTSPAVPLE